MIDLSIIIPVHNESSKIQTDIRKADIFLYEQNLTGQIIIVDDGSTDNTAKVAGDASQNTKAECLLSQLDKNFGKGRAVRTGIIQSTGKFVMFADSGNCIPFTDALKGIELIRSDKCQIAHGSRKLSDSTIDRPRSQYRSLCSNFFKWYLAHNFKQLAGFSDTQCGFKIYDGDTARKLYAQSTLDGFMFDIEIILLALTAEMNILEFAINWTSDPDSRLTPLRQSLRIFTDLTKLKKRFH